MAIKGSAKKIESLALADLIPYARNARQHSDYQIGQIAASIKEFGFNNPILIDAENIIVAGHGRALAAEKLGMKKVPCVRLGHLSENERRAYTLVDNKLALNAHWDFEMLTLEFEKLQAEGFDLELLGFDQDEIDRAFIDPSTQDFPNLPSGEKDPIQQMTFILSDDQVALVKRAIAIAKEALAIEIALNENSNGNALDAICKAFLTSHGDS